MQPHRIEVSGSVYLHKGKRTTTWRARLYLPTGETRRTIGPAWTGEGDPRRAATRSVQRRRGSTTTLPRSATAPLRA